MKKGLTGAALTAAKKYILSCLNLAIPNSFAPEDERPSRHRFCLQLFNQPCAHANRDDCLKACTDKIAAESYHIIAGGAPRCDFLEAVCALSLYLRQFYMANLQVRYYHVPADLSQIRYALSFATLAFLFISPFSPHRRLAYIASKLLFATSIPSTLQDFIDKCCLLPGDLQGVYAWVNLGSNDFYVGSTTQASFRQRWGEELRATRSRLADHGSHKSHSGTMVKHSDRFYGRMARNRLYGFVPIPLAVLAGGATTLESRLIYTLTPNMNTRGHPSFQSVRAAPIDGAAPTFSVVRRPSRKHSSVIDEAGDEGELPLLRKESYVRAPWIGFDGQFYGDVLSFFASKVNGSETVTLHGLDVLRDHKYFYAQWGGCLVVSSAFPQAVTLAQLLHFATRGKVKELSVLVTFLRYDSSKDQLDTLLSRLATEKVMPKHAWFSQADKLDLLMHRFVISFPSSHPKHSFVQTRLLAFQRRVMGVSSLPAEICVRVPYHPLLSVGFVRRHVLGILKSQNGVSKGLFAILAKNLRVVIVGRESIASLTHNHIKFAKAISATSLPTCTCGKCEKEGPSTPLDASVLFPKLFSSSNAYIPHASMEDVNLDLYKAVKVAFVKLPFLAGFDKEAISDSAGFSAASIPEAWDLSQPDGIIHNCDVHVTAKARRRYVLAPVDHNCGRTVAFCPLAYRQAV